MAIAISVPRPSSNQSTRTTSSQAYRTGGQHGSSGARKAAIADAGPLTTPPPPPPPSPSPRKCLSMLDGNLVLGQFCGCPKPPRSGGPTCLVDIVKTNISSPHRTALPCLAFQCYKSSITSHIHTCSPLHHPVASRLRLPATALVLPTRDILERPLEMALRGLERGRRLRRVGVGVDELDEPVDVLHRHLFSRPGPSH